jgi:hypothetical protein
MLIAYLIFGPFLLYIVFSLLMFLWLFFNNKTRNGFLSKHVRVINFGAFFGLFIILYISFVNILIFIPKTDEPATREAIATIISFLSTFFFVYVFQNYADMYNKIRVFKINAEIKKRYETAITQARSRVDLIKVRVNYAKELEILVKENGKRTLLPSELDEMETLSGLIAELDKMDVIFCQVCAKYE